MDKLFVNKELLLKRVALFSSLKKSELNRLVKRGTVEVFKSGETVIKEGEPLEGFYVVLSGRLQRFTGTDDKGKEQKANLNLFPGDYFGEISILTGAHSLSTVRVQNDCVLLKISKEGSV